MKRIFLLIVVIMALSLSSCQTSNDVIYASSNDKLTYKVENKHKIKKSYFGKLYYLKISNLDKPNKTDIIKLNDEYTWKKIKRNDILNEEYKPFK